MPSLTASLYNMADMEKSDGTDTSDRQSQLYERPGGLRGLYANPITQVCSLPLVLPSEALTISKGDATWFRLLYVPR